MSEPAVSVVVPTRSRPAFLADALDAIGAMAGDRFEVVVVDSGSPDPVPVAEVVRRAGARLVRCERPGISLARNTGVAAARGAIIAFTDDDCAPDPRWVEAIVAAFENHPDTAFLTGRTSAGEGRGGRGQIQLSVQEDTEPAVFAGADDDPFTMGHGANMAWRADALQQLGGFDELLGTGARLRAAEDTDAFWRARRHSLIGRYEPDAVVVHRQWRGRRAQLHSMHGYGVGVGAVTVKRWRIDHGGDRSWLRAEMARLVWHDGLVGVVGDLARGYEATAAARAVSTAGVVRGATLASRLLLDREHFQSPSTS
ncbi:MAG TPA: glycosyltransferase [Acidimicrobiales bacterium]|nr:glycosyltransferase [Acidimicrobiales bacterium]